MSQETYHQHETQKEKHVEDHIGDEIAHEKKAERRQQNETDAALTETADTILRGE